jgi:hypothetical protein
MSATARSFHFPRIVAVALPLMVGLGGCVAAPLLELAASPGPQAAACAAGNTGVTTGSCNTGSMGSMIPGIASLTQILAPVGAPAH